MALLAGDIVAGRKSHYRLVKHLGTGAAETWLAHDDQNRPCVLKALSLGQAEDWRAVELFEREAQVLSSVAHEEIPQLVESFPGPDDGPRRLFLIQEFIAGESLREKLQDRGPMPASEAVAIVSDLCRVLEYLHGLSPPVIHRDIKPSNVVLGEDGKSHLIDFGAVREKLRPITESRAGGATIVGTHGYMPMEQFAGHAVPASDVFALGMTLATLLTGIDPARFPRRGNVVLWRKLKGIPVTLHPLLSAATASDLHTRIPDALTLRQALEAWTQAPVRGPTTRMSVPRFLVVMLVICAFTGTMLWRLADAINTRGQQSSGEGERLADYSDCGAAPTVKIGTNLVTNPSFDGPCGWVWTPDLSTVALDTTDTFHGKTHAMLSGGHSAWQRIDVSALTDAIAQGGYAVTFRAALRRSGGGDTGNPYLYGYAMRKLQSGWVHLSGFPAHTGHTWQTKSHTWPLPAATSYIQVMLNLSNVAGEIARGTGHFDSVEVIVHPRDAPPAP